MSLLERNIVELENDISEVKFQVAEVVGEKECLQKKISYLKKKVGVLQNTKDIANLKNIDCLETECDFLSNKVKTLCSENRELKQLVALLEDKEIVTFHDGKYCNVF